MNNTSPPFPISLSHGLSYGSALIPFMHANSKTAAGPLGWARLTKLADLLASLATLLCGSRDRARAALEQNLPAEFN